MSIVDDTLFIDKNLIAIADHITEKICELYHNDQFCGHRGPEKSYDLMRNRFYWPMMKEFITDYISRCNCQQFKSTNNKPKAQLKPIEVKSTWAMIGIDIAGPLPTSINNNKYIIILVDYFSKYCIAKATIDCDFELDSNLYNCLELENGIRIAFISCTYHCG